MDHEWTLVWIALIAAVQVIALAMIQLWKEKRDDERAINLRIANQDAALKVAKQVEEVKVSAAITSQKTVKAIEAQTEELKTVIKNGN